MSTLQYEIIKNKDSDILEKHLKLEKNYSIYYSKNFLNLISFKTKADPFWFITKFNNKILAAIPFIQKFVGDIGVINSLGYFGSYGGVISCDQNVEIMLLTLKSF